MIMRNYNFADSKLLEHSGVVLEALETDLVAFGGLDPDLEASLATTLQTDYRAVLIEGGDDVVRNRVGQKTQDLLDETNKSGDMVKQLRYWVKKAFTAKPAVKRAFQLTKFWKIRNRTADLIVYMNMLATVVAQYRTELEAANVPVVFLDSVKTQAEALEKANNIQENSKAGRKHDTMERILKLNRIYEACKTFSDAAEFIFTEDPTRRELYRLPGNSQPSTEDEEGEIDDTYEI